MRALSYTCKTFCSKYSYQYSFFFFFSSRRRHTRCLSDWSSDVCSSDLSPIEQPVENAADVGIEGEDHLVGSDRAGHVNPVGAQTGRSGVRLSLQTPADVKIGRASCRERV